MNRIIKNTLFVATAFVLVSVQLVESAAAQPKRNHQNQRVLGNDHGDGAAIIAGILGGLMLGSILSDADKNNRYSRQEYRYRYGRQEYRYGRQMCYDNWVARYDRAGRKVIVNDPICNTPRGRR